MQRFLKYVAVDTQSDEDSDTFPSTEKQKVLAKMLAEELCQMGVPRVEIDEQYGYVYAKILSNRPDGEKVPVLGFIAHMDTSPEVSGADVKPQIIRQYDGKDIVLNKDKNIVCIGGRISGACAAYRTNADYDRRYNTAWRRR